MFAGTYSKSTFSSLYCLTSSISSLWITKMHLYECVPKKGPDWSHGENSECWTAPSRMNTYYTRHPNISTLKFKPLRGRTTLSRRTSRLVQPRGHWAYQRVQRPMCSHTAIPEQSGTVNKPWNQLIYLGNYWSYNISSILRGTFFSCFNVSEIRVHLKTDHKDSIA